VKFINTIRKKVWFCVNVAFVGFIVATGFTLYSNHQQTIHLSHIRDLDFHLAMRSNELLNLFGIQKNYYKDSFLFGSSDSATKGNALCERITTGIKSITQMKRSLHGLPADRNESLVELEKNYQEYVLQALQLLSATQNEIQSNLKYFAKFYSQHFERNVTHLVDITNRNSFLLAAFFLLLLIAMSLIVNLAAKRMLISPLAHIKEAVQAFGRGKRSFPALEAMDDTDDIGELGGAIITMTKDLVNTTVSKAHVDSILHNMNDSLIVTSNRFQITSVNRATLDMLGYKEDELIDRNIGKVLGEFQHENTDPEISADDRFSSHLCSNAERTFFTCDGKEIPVLLSTSLLKDNENITRGLVYVAKDITVRKRAEEKLEQMALFDYLTGLPNRMTFNDRLEQTLKQAHREGNQAGLMFIDLDRFKKINDSIGHLSGDELLKKVANWLSDSVRESDTVARIGGDEFAVILDNINEPQDAVNTAERILDAFVQPINFGGQKVFSSPSIGIALYPLDAQNSVDLLRNADKAMYQAKQTGGNSYVFFSRKR
jgi:diguanylate cyclase (GGDEF)-like protein/PAS domain S-box-containing protein